MRYFVLLLFFPLAQAQDTFLGRAFDAGNWMTTLQQNAEGYLSEIRLLSIGLLALAIVCSVVYVMMTRSAETAVNTFVRLLIVIGLLSSTTAITNLTYWTWGWLQNWSMDQLADVYADGSDELQQLGEDSAALLGAAMIPVGGAFLGAKLTSKMWVQTASRTANRSLVQSVGQWLNMAIIPIVFFVILSHLIVLLTGLALVVANIMLPIAVVNLMFGGANGEKWLGAYISTVMTAIFIVALMPLAFRAAFDFAIVTPVRVINENFADVNALVGDVNGTNPPQRVADIQGEIEGLEDQRATIIQDAVDNGYSNPWADPQTFDRISAVEEQITALEQEYRQTTEDFIERTQRVVGERLSGFFNDAKRWAMRLALLIIGALLGSYLLMSHSSAVAGVIGGIGFGVAARVSQPMRVFSGRLASGGSSQQPQLPAKTQTSGSAPSTPTPALGGGAKAQLGPNPGGKRAGT
jgi:hypothetical protein